MISILTLYLLYPAGENYLYKFSDDESEEDEEIHEWNINHQVNQINIHINIVAKNKWHLIIGCSVQKPRVFIS